LKKFEENGIKWNKNELKRIKKENIMGADTVWLEFLE
jgi:hypothetical protein